MKTLKEMFRIEHRECSAAEGFALLFLAFFLVIPVWAFPFARDYHDAAVREARLRAKHVMTQKDMPPAALMPSSAVPIMGRCAAGVKLYVVENGALKPAGVSDPKRDYPAGKYWMKIGS